MNQLIDEVQSFLKECGVSPTTSHQSLPLEEVSSFLNDCGGTTTPQSPYEGNYYDFKKKISDFLGEDIFDDNARKLFLLQHTSSPLFLFEIPKNPLQLPLENHSENVREFFRNACENPSLLQLRDCLQQKNFQEVERFRVISIRLEEYLLKLQKGLKNFLQLIESRQTAVEAVNYLRRVFMAEMASLIDDLYQCLQLHIDDKMSCQMVQLLNQYLENLGAYTYPPPPKGSYITNEQSRYFDVKYYYVNHQEDTGKVQLVDRLPYVMEYFDYAVQRKAVFAGRVYILASV